MAAQAAQLTIHSLDHEKNVGNNNENNDDNNSRLTSGRRKHTSTLTRELSALESPTARIRDSRITDSGNRIVNWDSLRSMITSNISCNVCGGDVELAESTAGVATDVTLTCKCCDLRAKKSSEKHRL